MFRRTALSKVLRQLLCITLIEKSILSERYEKFIFEEVMNHFPMTTPTINDRMKQFANLIKVLTADSLKIHPDVGKHKLPIDMRKLLRKYGADMTTGITFLSNEARQYLTYFAIEWLTFARAFMLPKLPATHLTLSVAALDENCKLQHIKDTQLEMKDLLLFRQEMYFGVEIKSPSGDSAFGYLPLMHFQHPIVSDARHLVGKGWTIPMFMRLMNHLYQDANYSEHEFVLLAFLAKYGLLKNKDHYLSNFRIYPGNGTLNVLPKFVHDMHDKSATYNYWREFRPTASTTLTDNNLAVFAKDFNTNFDKFEFIVHTVHQSISLMHKNVVTRTPRSTLINSLYKYFGPYISAPSYTYLTLSRITKYALGELNLSIDLTAPTKSDFTTLTITASEKKSAAVPAQKKSAKKRAKKASADHTAMMYVDPKCTSKKLAVKTKMDFLVAATTVATEEKCDRVVADEYVLQPPPLPTSLPQKISTTADVSQKRSQLNLLERSLSPPATAATTSTAVTTTVHKFVPFVVPKMMSSRIIARPLGSPNSHFDDNGGDVVGMHLYYSCESNVYTNGVLCAEMMVFNGIDYYWIIWKFPNGVWAANIIRINYQSPAFKILVCENAQMRAYGLGVTLSPLYEAYIDVLEKNTTICAQCRKVEWLHLMCANGLCAVCSAV
jgi:hypothetical protein